MAKRPSIPRYKRRRRDGRSWPRRIFGWVVKLIVAFFVISFLWVLAYRFVNPPITFTMMSDILAGRGAARDWMPIEQFDRDMVCALVGGEDNRICWYAGFGC